MIINIMVRIGDGDADGDDICEFNINSTRGFSLRPGGEDDFIVARKGKGLLIYSDAVSSSGSSAWASFY